MTLHGLTRHRVPHRRLASDRTARPGSFCARQLLVGVALRGVTAWPWGGCYVLIAVTKPLRQRIICTPILRPRGPSGVPDEPSVDTRNTVDLRVKWLYAASESCAQISLYVVGSRPSRAVPHVARSPERITGQVNRD
jgi:hypothetical protein